MATVGPMDVPETGRQAALVLLDAITAWDDKAEDDNDNIVAANRALGRISEIGAIQATIDDNDAVDVDVADLVGGTLVLLHWAIGALANAAETDRLDVIASARAFIADEHH